MDLRHLAAVVAIVDDGTFTGYCLYETDDLEALRDHTDALMLPTDAIKPVVATTVAAPDPEPVSTI